MLDSIKNFWSRIQSEISTFPFMGTLASLSLSLLILLYISIPAMASITLIPAAAWYAITGIILVIATFYSISPFIQKTILEKKIKNSEQSIEENKQQVKNYEKKIKTNKKDAKENKKTMETLERIIETHPQDTEEHRQQMKNYEGMIKNYRSLIEDYEQEIKNTEQEIKNTEQSIEPFRQEIKEFNQKIKSLQKKTPSIFFAYAAITLSLLAIALYTFVVFPITLPIAMAACAAVQIIGLALLTFHDNSKTTIRDRRLLILPFAVCSIATMIIIPISPTWTQILVQLSITQAFPPLTIALLVLSSVILVLCLLKAVDAKETYGSQYETHNTNSNPSQKNFDYQEHSYNKLPTIKELTRGNSNPDTTHLTHS